MAEQTTNNLEGYRVATTFRGLLHFPHSIDATLTQQTVYDGRGTATALALGGDTRGATIHGDLNVSDGSLTASGSATIGGSATISGNIKLSGDVNLLNGGNINDVIVLSAGSSVNLRTPKTTEVGKLRIRESVDDYELLFGDPTVATPNLFSIIVKKNSGNNLYIKNNYGDSDILSPLWINRSTGEVNIKQLNVTNIKTVLPPGKSPPPGQDGYGDSNRSTIPIGMVAMFPVSGMPSGWLICDGRDHSKTSLPELFTVIGYNYNNVLPKSGDRFQVPDYRGAFIRGLDYKRDDESSHMAIDPQTGRALNGSMQVDTFKSHKHGETYRMGGTKPEGISGGHVTEEGSYDRDTGYTGDLETRPKNIVAVYCIKW
jgi:hypothetical protein